MLGVLPQAQQNRLDRVPLWIWVLVIFLVVLVGIIWTLREEEEQLAQSKSTRPASIPEPVVSPAGEHSAPPVELSSPPVVEADPHIAPTGAAPPTAAEVAADFEAPSVEAPEAPPPKPDDLKKVKGIGPKIAQQLNERGIYTFEQLANTPSSTLERWMDELDWYMADATSWPEQARHLAERKRQSGR